VVSSLTTTFSTSLLLSLYVKEFENRTIFYGIFVFFHGTQCVRGGSRIWDDGFVRESGDLGSRGKAPVGGLWDKSPRSW